MNTTTNLGLLKPEYSDVADIKDINDNMDTLDGIIGALPEGATVQEQIDDINDEIGNTALPTTAQTLTGAIAEHETDLGTKLNKNQGSGNSGKVMVVDEDGEIIPTDFPSTPIDDTKGIGDTDFVWSADKDAKEVLKIDGTKANTESAFTYKETYGSVVEFDDGVSEAVKQMRIDIAPLQDLHGYNHPWVGGAGKNLLGLNMITTASTYTTITSITNGVKISNSQSATYRATLTPTATTLGLVNGQTYTFSAHAKVISGAAILSFRRTSDNGIIVQSNALTSGEGDLSVTYTYDSSVPSYASMFCTFTSSLTGEVEYTNIQIEKGSSATAYEPYSNICPISGWTGANVTRTGKNLLGYSNSTGGTSSGVTWVNNHDGSFTVNGTASGANSYPNGGVNLYSLGVLPAGTYTMSVRDIHGNLVRECYCRIGAGSSSTYYAMNNGSVTFTADGTTQYWGSISVENGKTVNYLTIYPQFEKGSVATSYIEPQKTYSITFPTEAGTVYGGTLTVNQDGTGTLVVDKARVDLGICTWTKETWGSGVDFYTNGIMATVKAPADNATVANAICDSYKMVSRDTLYATTEKCISILPTGHIKVRDDYADATAFTTAMSGIYVVYELASPSTYTLTTDQVVHLLSGQNTVYADCGDITLLYPTDKYLTAEQAERERIHESIAVSAPVQTIADGADNVPMDVSVAIEPVQDLHGYANPWVSGAGKNIVDASRFPNTASSNGVTYERVSENGIPIGVKATGTASALAYCATSYFPIKAGTYIYSSSVNESVSAIDSMVQENDVTIARGNSYTPGQTFTVASDTSIRILIRTNPNYAIPTGGVVFKPMIRLASITDDTFAPYSNICPITGWTQAKVNRTGKNLFDKNNAIRGKVITTTGDISDSTKGILSDYIYVPNGQITFSAMVSFTSGTDNCLRIARYDENKNFIDRILSTAVSSGSKAKITSNNQNVKYVRANFLTSTENIDTAQLEYGTEATTYEPFGTTYTIPFNTDVYGGSLTVNKDGTGTLTVDYLSFAVKDVVWTYDSSYTRFYHSFADIMKEYGTRKQVIQSSCFFNPHDGEAVADIPDKSIYNGGSNKFIYIKDTEHSTVASFTEAYGDQTFLVELATPVTYTIPAPVIRSLLGTNNVWADTGNILSLNYSADTKTYIDNLFNSIINATGVSF